MEPIKEEEGGGGGGGSGIPIATLYSTDDYLTNESDINFINNEILTENNTKNNVRFHIPDAFDSNSNSNNNISYNTNNNDQLNNQLTADEIEKVNKILNDRPTNADNFEQITVEPQNEFINQQQTVLVRPSSKSLIGNLRARKLSASVKNPFSGHSSSSCGHQNAGQELCYLCHQRNRRNVPVYLHEELRQKELEEDNLLMQYQHLKDMEKKLNDDEKMNARRIDRAKQDAFNLGVAEAIKAKKNERPKTSDLSVSYIITFINCYLIKQC
jgi:hypothetical protein